MKYSSDDFIIEFADKGLKFTGSIELSEQGYNELKSIMEEMLSRIHSEPLVFDFKDLNYLNSRGIRFLVDFITKKNQKRVKIIVNNTISWQKTSIGFLSKLAPGKIEVL